MCDIDKVIRLRRYIRDITYQYEIINKTINRVKDIQDKYEHHFFLRFFDALLIPKKYSEFWHSIKDLHVALRALQQYDKAIKALNREIDKIVTGE